MENQIYKDWAKDWAVAELEKYDSLPAEIRLLVQQYGDMPYKSESHEQYKGRMIRQHPQGAI